MVVIVSNLLINIIQSGSLHDMDIMGFNWILDIKARLSIPQGDHH